MTEELRRPAPADVWERIDRDLMHGRITELVVDHRPDLMEDLLAGGLVWNVEPFDAEGWTTVRLLRKVTGEDTDAGAQAHWSSLVRHQD